MSPEATAARMKLMLWLQLQFSGHLFFCNYSESCSSPASQSGSWPVNAAGIRPTSLLIFISDHHLCNYSQFFPHSCAGVHGDGNLLYLWAGAKPVEPPRHPSLKARNKHQEKAARELCLCFLCHTEPQSDSSMWEQNSASQETSHYWASFCAPPVPRNATSHDRCTSETAHKSQIHILLTQIWTLRSECSDTWTSADPMLSLLPPKAFKQSQFHSKTKWTGRLLLKTDCELGADGIE